MPRKSKKADPESVPTRLPPTAPKTLPKRDPVTGTWLGKEVGMRANTFDGFMSWYNDRKPRILVKGKYEWVTLTSKQVETLKGMLTDDGKGNFKHSMSLLIWPRRHSKSVMLRLVCLWLLDTRSNITIQCHGNGEIHSRRVQFNPIVKVIQNTPALRKRMPERIAIQRNVIIHPTNGSRLQTMVGSSTVFGDKIDILYIDDYHHCPDLPAVNALQAALLDQDNALTLIGSNVDPLDGHVHLLQKLAEEDQGIYADHLQYRDWAAYETDAPVWIDRGKAKRLEKTLLSSEFNRDILGQRTQAVNSLFEGALLEACRMPYKAPVEKDFRELVQGRACKIGAGLDRAKSLLGDGIPGKDNTIFTVIAKVAKHNGEPEIFILNQVNVVPNTAQHIKKLIRDAHDLYRLDNLTIEDYQAMDIEPWCIEQNIPVEMISAHSNRQNAMFPELHRIVKEGRLHFPSDMKELMAEMKSFQYTLLREGKYSFGASGIGHDDRVYSLGWAIYSLRSEVLAVYALGNIQCLNRGKSRPFCLLLGGNLELNCTGTCLAFQQVKTMYREFKKFHTESHLDIGQFYKRYVRVTGSLIYQAA